MIIHHLDCGCPRCKALHAAFAATNPDGSDFFTDDELAQLAAEPGDDDPELVWADPQ